MSTLQTKPIVAQSSATITTVSQAPAGSSAASLRTLKGSMTLPLHSSVNVGHIRGLTPLAQLNSPDLKNLGLPASGVTPFLTSPDFEKLVSQSLTVGVTPTSAAGNAPQTPTTFLNPKFVTEEQERFVMNFDEKINRMIKQEREGGTGAGADENQLNTPVVMDISGSYAAAAAAAAAAAVAASAAASAISSSSSVISSSSAAATVSSVVMTAPPLDTARSIVVTSSSQQAVAQPIFSATRLSPAPSSIAVSSLHQPQQSSSVSYSDSDDPMDASCGPGGSGLRMDLTDQEQLKLERKRQRNRDAARKCRERKLERIRFLEERVAELKSQNGRLQRTAVDLREQVKTLQHVIVEHTKRGCSLKDSLNAKLGLA